MNDLARLEGSIDKRVAGSTLVSSSVGGLLFGNMAEVMEFAKLMAVSGQAVPKHLRGQAGACLAIATQAMNWRMDPFTVANKSYAVNDRIAYEAQLVQAVIEQRAPIKGRIKGYFEGDGSSRVCVLSVVSAEDGETIEYRSPEFGRITTKNSPLWKADPDQQLWYYSARAMCRRHFPDVLLGVYAADEIEGAAKMKDVTPNEEMSAGTARMNKLRQEAKGQVEAEDATADPDEATERPNDEPDDPNAVVDAEIVADPESEWFKEGAKAVQDFGPSASCPEAYETGSTEHVNWLAGFSDQIEKDQSEEAGDV